MQQQSRIAMIQQMLYLLHTANFLCHVCGCPQNAGKLISFDAGMYNKYDAVRDNHTCAMSINTTSAEYLKSAIEAYEPNFARIELRFRYVHPVKEPFLLEPSTSHTEDAIMPYKWVWTYYKPDGFFPYLKWPVDFSILSFGLLDAKTLQALQFLVVEVEDSNCSVTIGNPDTLISISYALGNLTKDYLLDIKTAFSYSYWCHLAVIPGVKDTLAYQFGIYFAFPVEFVRYNCCRTQLLIEDNSSFSIQCVDHQLGKLWQGTIVPYILGLVAFAYFPIILFSACGRLSSIGKKDRHLQVIASNDIINDESEYVEDWTFLDGNPPICLTTVIGGMCGLVEKYPIAVSRVRRFLFVLFGPTIIFCELYVYYKFEYDTTMDLIDHGCPMGYLSMLGGFEKSKNNFLPVFGGPYFLLFVFYVAGFIFLVTPSHPDRFILDGTIRYSSFGEISALFLNIKTIENYSQVIISNETCGYKRLAVLSKAMFYALMNPKFWYNAIKIVFSRFNFVFNLCSSTCTKTIAFVLFLPVYLVICTVELVLCVLYYGIPVFNAICIIFTGYVLSMLDFLRRRSDRSYSLFWVVFNNYVTKCVLALILSCLFVYFMFSFCTIFILSFAFLSEVFVFSFFAVIIYPSTSFGYLFFGIVFLYYIFKTFQGFGGGYIELLADAVETSSHLENDIYRNQVIDGTVIIDDTVFEITKLQIRNRIINLSTDQREAIRGTCIRQKPKLIYRNHTAGIPLDLFLILVKKYRPVHIQMTHALLRICLILALISFTISMLVIKPHGPSEDISEMMHVVFIVAVGALPRVLEVAMDNVNHHVKKEIHLRQIRSTINDYWNNQMQEE